MNKILGLDSAYNDAINRRNGNMLISANLVAEMADRIRELEVVAYKPVDHAKCLALYLESNIGSIYSCLRDDLADFINESHKTRSNDYENSNLH